MAFGVIAMREKFVYPPPQHLNLSVLSRKPILHFRLKTGEPG